MHYYTKTGDSMHEIVGKNGRKRPTTVADARKLNLFPSVSTIKDTGAGYSLVQWMLELLLEQSARVLYDDDPEIDFEKDLVSRAGYKELVLGLYKSVKEEPADVGNKIHAAFDNYFEKGLIPVEYFDYIKPSISWIEHTFPDYRWFPEKSFAHKDGFGGRVDLWGADKDYNCVIIDYKTKNKTELSKSMQYEDHRIQLAAYQKGLGLPDNTRRFNIFVSVHEETKGEFLPVECTNYKKHIEIFDILVLLWQKRNNYKPEAV